MSAKLETLHKCLSDLEKRIVSNKKKKWSAEIQRFLWSLSIKGFEAS